MTKVKLNKSSLSREIKNLKNYKQFLPALDLKRRKLLAVKVDAIQEHLIIEKEITTVNKKIKDTLPMAAYDEIKLDELIKVNEILIKTENIVGVRLPVYVDISFTQKPYLTFNTPLWLDDYVALVKEVIITKIRIEIAKSRIKLIEKSLVSVTQRKNLFEKVLIPKTRETIRIIQLFLADNERAAVVRSKIAKRKRSVQ